MRTGWGVAMAAGAIAVACGSGGSDGGASSGGSSSGASSGTTSSSSSSGSSSGGGSSGTSSGGSTSTVCTPTLAPGFFDSATPVDGVTFGAAPCPAGYHAKPVPFQPFPASFPEPVRYTTQSDFVTARCDVDDAGAGDAGGGVTIDFASHDLVVVLVAGIGVSTAPLLSREGELWVRRNHRQCGGAQDMVNDAYYIVAKGAALNVESCTTTCVGCMAP